MRVSAIQNYGGTVPTTKTFKTQSNLYLQKTHPKINKDSITFEGNKALKGFGFGAAVGLAAVTFMTGGLATPLGIAMYCAATGTTGGIIGHELDKLDDENR